jgi:hypothetical protein
LSRIALNSLTDLEPNIQDNQPSSGTY